MQSTRKRLQSLDPKNRWSAIIGRGQLEDIRNSVVDELSLTDTTNDSIKADYCLALRSAPTPTTSPLYTLRSKNCLIFKDNGALNGLLSTFDRSSCLRQHGRAS